MGAALESVLESLLADGHIIGVNSATGSVSEASDSPMHRHCRWPFSLACEALTVVLLLS